MAGCELDHLVVTAPSLAAGARYVQDKLGVALQAGGEHPRMGTHNLLLRLNDSSYLEVIAPNPDAPKPSRPRWFDLDDLTPESEPRLATWVARTTDIEGTAARSPVDLGSIETMTRGDLEWRITIRADGRMPQEGVAPSLIEWRIGTHPAQRLQPSGCSLVRLKAMYPEPRQISDLLESIGFEGPVTISPLGLDEFPQLIAEIETPAGVRELT